MLSVSEAQAQVLARARPLTPLTVPLDANALGLVLAEDVASDTDMPPFDKALMDGYAVRCADLVAGHGSLEVVDEIMAGQTPHRPVGPRQATRIMTGAPLPKGADAVVIVERTRLLEGNCVQIDDQPPRPGQNILPLGNEMRRGETIFRVGMVLRPQHMGTLATVGRSRVSVYPAVEVAVLPTGDELVEAGEIPGPGQIRNGNGPMLLAQVQRAGCRPRALAIARDRLDSLEPLVSAGLESPVLILSGGVSAGKLDLVPGVLQKLGVEAHFHKVTMKPGKPVFFGTRGATLVFGLPGNPVSSLVCFELFVRPALLRLTGHADSGSCMVQATLAEDFAYQSDRPTYYPARLEATGPGWQVHAMAWSGSSDLRSLAHANAFLVLPPGNYQNRAGQVFSVLGLGLRS